MDEDKRKKMVPTWIENEHGIKSVWPREVAERLIRKNYGWSFTTPDIVPEKKQFPIGSGELTPVGLARRTAATNTAVVAEARPVEEKNAEADNLSLDDLKTRAKRLGVEKYWCKSEARLRKEVAEKEA